LYGAALRAQNAPAGLRRAWRRGNASQAASFPQMPAYSPGRRTPEWPHLPVPAAPTLTQKGLCSACAAAPISICKGEVQICRNCLRSCGICAGPRRLQDTKRQPAPPMPKARKRPRAAPNRRSPVSRRRPARQAPARSRRQGEGRRHDPRRGPRAGADAPARPLRAWQAIPGVGRAAGLANRYLRPDIALTR
jgi:hypothetical protein